MQIGMLKASEPLGELPQVPFQMLGQGIEEWCRVVHFAQSAASDLDRTQEMLGEASRGGARRQLPHRSAREAAPESVRAPVGEPVMTGLENRSRGSIQLTVCLRASFIRNSPESIRCRPQSASGPTLRGQKSDPLGGCQGTGNEAVENMVRLAGNPPIEARLPGSGAATGVRVALRVALRQSGLLLTQLLQLLALLALQAGLSRLADLRLELGNPAVHLAEMAELLPIVSPRLGAGNELRVASSGLLLTLLGVNVQNSAYRFALSRNREKFSRKTCPRTRNPKSGNSWRHRAGQIRG